MKKESKNEREEGGKKGGKKEIMVKFKRPLYQSHFLAFSLSVLYFLYFPLNMLSVKHFF